MAELVLHFGRARPLYLLARDDVADVHITVVRILRVHIVLEDLSSQLENNIVKSQATILDVVPELADLVLHHLQVVLHHEFYALSHLIYLIKLDALSFFGGLRVRKTRTAIVFVIDYGQTSGVVHYLSILLVGGRRDLQELSFGAKLHVTVEQWLDFLDPVELAAERVDQFEKAEVDGLNHWLRLNGMLDLLGFEIAQASSKRHAPILDREGLLGFERLFLRVR